MQKMNFRSYFYDRIKNKAFTAVITVYLMLCLSSAMYWIIDFQTRNLLMSLAFVLFIPLMLIVEYTINIRFGELFEAAILFLAFGSILGSCFNLYTTLPFLDTLLHGISGIIFGCFGFALAEIFFGKALSPRRFWGSLIFAICFSLAIAVLWEIFEYTCTSFFGLDMMEDAYVSDIRSYLLAGSHTEVVELDGIIKTIIHYGNGQTYIIDGYLDLGLIDTMTDMIICTVGAAAFAGIALLGYFKYPKINKILIPQIIDKTCDSKCNCGLGKELEKI
ncbi:MAG: hypothetical protein E7617_01420 [Ruminococcaceae bacterium]|nr:hypothetical protein [Oscillospiraceae bacterium]